MKRRKILTIAAVVVGMPILLLLLVLLYLNFADLSGWRDTVANLASDAIGRELRINGEFQPEVGFTTRVVATDVTLANDTEFGLAAYFCARDVGRVWRVSEGLEYGIIGVNEGIISNEMAPFGGVKESGSGREGSKYGIEDYVEIKYMLMGGLDR